ncbi:hypothetical protein QY884_08710 [Latilactobacillus sakei]
MTGTTATQDALPQTGHQSVWGSVLVWVIHITWCCKLPNTSFKTTLGGN